ncbi:tetratricopeptide repeat protein [Actinomadura sp. NTSP31]|uniref:tetratricopeptide repeat protein n=1 Tax=Actinomadura sp. NTSP31 TaxID=1735447 RepID=UPI0035C0D25C
MPAALPAVARVPAGGAVKLPRLPSPVFVGRDEVLDGLRATVRDGPGVIAQAVVGLGGIGKSELALQYADRHRGDYDLVWWVLAETADDVQAGLADLCRALCAPIASAAAAQAPAPEAAAWALAWLAAHDRWLVVFDNAEDVTDLEPLLGRLAGGHVLVTSRRAVGWDAIGTVLRLPVLRHDDAVDLLKSLTGPAGAGSGGAGSGGADDLAGELGGLPLALRQAGAYIAAVPGMTVQLYLRRLRESAHWAVSTRPPVGRRSDRQLVAATWSMTMDRVRDEHPLAGRVMRLLACFASDRLPCDVLYGLPGADPVEVGEALAALASYSMIELSADHRYVGVHRLVQAVTRAALTGEDREHDMAVAAELIRKALPDDHRTIGTWPRWADLLPHARQVLDPASDAMDAVLDYLSASGNYRAGLELQRLSAAASERVYGPEHPRTLIARGNLAYATGAAGDAAGARDMYAALLPVRARVLGAEHPSVLVTRGNLARWTGEAGDEVTARDMCEELLPVMARVLGAEHPRTLTVRSNLASWTGGAGNVDAAKDLYAELLPVIERVQGAEHPDTLTTRANFAYWTGEAGDAAAARDLSIELLSLRERVLGPEHPSTLNARAGVASWAGMAGDAAAARDGYAALLPLRKRVQGPEHPATLNTWANCAYWTGRAGDAAAARDLYAELLPVIERVMGPLHSKTLSARAGAASWAGKAGDAAAARDRYAELLPLRVRVQGAEHFDTLLTRANLALWTAEAGDAVTARDMGAALLPVRERVLGPEHRNTLTTRSNLAHWTGKAGDPVTARDQYAELVPVLERVLGADDPDTVAARRRLAYWSKRAARRDGD